MSKDGMSREAGITCGFPLLLGVFALNNSRLALYCQSS